MMDRFHHARPYEAVTSNYQFPFEAYPFQIEAIDRLAPAPRSALYWEPGLGKTYGSTVCALHHRMQGADTTLIIMPPILIAGWDRFLTGVRHADGSPMKVLKYRGTPKERRTMRLTGHDFVLMSMDIFKRDNARISEDLGHLRVHVISDESTSLKNVSSQNHKTFREFTYDKSFQLLTGTPMNKVEDAYAYIRLIAPGVYKTLHQFASIHVEEVDFFGKPTKYRNLELLRENLLINADRRIKEEVLLDLPAAIINPIYYDLDPPHYALYKKLAEEELLTFDDGRKLDATNVSALWNALQQIILNWDHFSQDEANEARGFELIQAVLDEIEPAKLMVFANYRMSNGRLSERFKHANAVGIWGGISSKQKDLNWRRFLDDPECRLIHMQPSSAGLGLDGGQHVCSDVLYIECPITPMLYQQSMSRCYRDGQKLPVNVRIAVAQGTLQARTLKSLIEKQDLVMSVQGGLADLKSAIFGN